MTTQNSQIDNNQIALLMKEAMTIAAKRLKETDLNDEKNMAENAKKLMMDIITQLQPKVDAERQKQTKKT